MNTIEALSPVSTQEIKDSPTSPFKEFEHFQPVPRIEVKRCYVVSQTLRKSKDRAYLRKMNPEEFQAELDQAKGQVLKLPEDELDKYISREYPRRLKAYNSVNWYRGLIHPEEVGVWRKAGGLPEEWTNGSLAETAERVAEALRVEGGLDMTTKAKRLIPRMQELADIISEERYLLPIILPGGTMGRGIRGTNIKPFQDFRILKGDIDDGCMRSTALVSSGKQVLQVYVGMK